MFLRIETPQEKRVLINMAETKPTESKSEANHFAYSAFTEYLLTITRPENWLKSYKLMKIFCIFSKALPSKQLNERPFS